MIQMKQLIQQLNDASAAYYAGSPYMSDIEFDKMYDELKTLEATTGIVYSNSPTQNVGSQIITNIPKIKIEPIPMLSLKKVHTIDKIKEFTGSRQAVVRSIKCDGLSVRLIYKEGKLVSANTRGNGVEGGLVTSHIPYFLNVPVTIPCQNDFIIDGEAIIKTYDFEDIAKDTELKNPRNAAAGALNTLDLNIVKGRRLSFIAWDVIQGGYSNSFMENLNQAKEYGFETVYASLYDNNQDILDIAKRLGIPCDGVVWRFDGIEYGRSLGRTEKAFNNAVAWKPADETYSTTLIDLEWGMGRTGVLTPIAAFEPVEIDGTTVERASLHNVFIVNEIFGPLGPYRGQEIEIFKANMIIPQVYSANQKQVSEDRYIECIKICPVCGQPLARKFSENSIFMMCENAECDGKLANKLDHFCGKSGLDIKGISKATIEKLIEWDWVNESFNLFMLSEHREEWIKKPGFGPKSVDKILAAIDKASKNCQLSQFICALGIPLIGSTASKVLAKTFGSWDDFMRAVKDPAYSFEDLEDFGYEMNKALKEHDYTEAVCAVDCGYIVFAAGTPAPATTLNDLEGKTFVITGKVFQFKNRDELKAYIEARGGKVAGSVSGNTSYLINNDFASASAKNQTAKKLNIPIITEEKFISLFGEIT